MESKQEQFTNLESMQLTIMDEVSLQLKYWLYMPAEVQLLPNQYLKSQEQKQAYF